MKFTKNQFKEYIRIFDNSFKESVKRNFHSINEINDLSNIVHSLDELNNFKYSSDFKLFYTNNISIITTNKLDKHLKYLIFVEIGKLKDNSSIGSIYFIYDYIENQIIKNLEKDISFSNYCFNQKDLNKMLKF